MLTPIIFGVLACGFDEPYSPMDAVEPLDPGIDPRAGDVPMKANADDVTLPDTFLGTFDVDLESCEQPVSPTRVTIRNTGISNIDGVAAFEEIDRVRGAYVAQTSFVAQGEEPTSPVARIYRLVVAADDDIELHQGSDHTRLSRCP